MNRMIFIMPVALAGCATSSAPEAPDYSTMSCLQLSAEARVEEMTLDTLQQEANANRSATVYEGPSTGFSSGSAINAGAAGAASRIARETRESRDRMALIIRERAARPCDN